MGRSSLYNVMALPDAFQTHAFDLYLPNLPGGGDSVTLTYKCQTSVIPGFSLDKVEIALQGVTKQEAGRAIYSHSFPCTFLEVADMSTRNAIRAWRETCRSQKKNTGSVSSAYKVNGQMVLYDNQPSVIKTVMIYGMWPETVDDLNLEGNASTAGLLTVNFSYDWTDEDN